MRKFEGSPASETTSARMKTMGDVVADPIDETDGTAQPASASKEFGQRTLRSLKRGLGRLWRRHRGNASITEYDPSYKVAYLGNVLTGWAKGEGCVEKPVSTLWRNYVTSNRPDVSMRLTVTNGGLTATTKDHGLTEYWAHRVTYCTAPASHPRLFVWVYRHEGRRLRPELRCHAALCSKESTARRLASVLNTRLQQALMEFRRDKVSRQNARLSLANALYDNPSLPRRKLLLSTGGQNYRPPLERSKSAPKLSAIEEDTVAEEMEQKRLLEELRSLENAHSWEDQDGWIARLLDALHRESDENGSISSGCETASTATSEERAAGPEEHLAQNQNDQRGLNRRFIISEDRVGRGLGPRRNSEGSPHFMTCTGSPRFKPIDSMKRFPLSEEEESMEEEEEEMEDTVSNMFNFVDVEDLDNVVDYRPRGEIMNRIEDPQKRERRANEKYPSRIGHEFLQNEETSFLTLDSLDEEADSDESGYVEAPPKSLLGQDDKKEDEEESKHPRLELFTNKEENNSESTCRTDGSESQRTKHEDSEVDNQEEKTTEKKGSLLVVNDNQRIKEREKERVDFKYPISDTIRKLASASLRSSKSFEMTNNSCLNVLNNFKTSKSFDSVKNDEITVDSPSLHQRKQLLAQRGVMV
ncbi:uncharacterized protein LOC105838677 [Monomorium pharaonis]|uniref:uncharacterized protein LOC105838677 n=1 Tax=Monomorium pharaonis TaxID=307658 RepID=UPI00063EE209|nr:uncharacterized protein LOC105838677 [Monomorium pharaonis]XP_012539859.1 uncharacterized protein LOC105838677 [Monomorium pharaonis]XP_012539860.1 uncharacterized protein LOC105838677 [Monomorium pharaonis]